MKPLRWLMLGFLLGSTSGVLVAQFTYWSKSQVTAVVIVKPIQNGLLFVPETGSAGQTSWVARDVVPFVEVVSNGFGGFRPKDGNTMLTWSQSQVRPTVIVQPNGFGNFEPVK